MNANDFFEQYTIETINKRTRISPISLRFIKNREFEKIPRVKFLGFVRIIEKEFGIDLSDLIEEYNQATDAPKNIPDTDQNINEKTKTPKKHNTFLLFILALILFSLGAYLLYKRYSSGKTPQSVTQNAFIPNEENTSGVQNTTAKTDAETENNISSQTPKPPPVKIKKQPIIPKEVKITPNKKVWFRALNLDTNKSVQYLTSNPKTLKGADWYIKFGHGNITINYGNRTITPKTKKIVRLLFKNGKITYLKYPNRYEK